MLIVEGFFEII